MRRITMFALSLLFLYSTAFPQDKGQKPTGDQPIRISTELVQLDVVVTDKNGRVVKGLTKDSFELYESGKKQQISFFEFVEVGKGRRQDDLAKPAEQPSPQGATESEIKRIFAFVVDDLTTRPEDMIYVRQMLTNYVDNQMQDNDLVAVVRTVGGRGLLQQFTTNKDLLRRAIAALTPSSSPFNLFNRNEKPQRLTPTGEPLSSPDMEGLSGEVIDISSPLDDTNQTLRSYMSLGTASFVIDSMKQLPGRKSLVLISGGLPILGGQAGTVTTVQPGLPVATQASTSGVDISYYFNLLADRATRAGVAIHTMDIRGLSAQVGIARFTDTPGRGALGGGVNPAFGRMPDESLLGNRNPFDVMESQMGLRALALATGGIAVINKNNFNEGLEKILDASDGYYLLAYTPSEAKFGGDFRKVEVKVKHDGLKVYSRRGYFAREEKPVTAPATKQEQMLAAIKSPLARRDVDLDAMLLYKATSADQGAIDIHLVIDPRKLQFGQVDGKQQANVDVAGFVFDQLGKLRGGFSETITASLTEEEYRRVSTGGLTYSANTTLPAGIYQIRLAVRDNLVGSIGTLSRYLEVPDLSKGRLAASSLLLGAVPPGDIKAASPTSITANRQISRKHDLRYAMFIYNAKLKDGRPQLRSQLAISQGGKVIFQEPEEPIVASRNDNSQLLKLGQLGLSGVKPGRYTLTLVITDTLADRKAQTITRSMDFVVAP